MIDEQETNLRLACLQQAANDELDVQADITIKRARAYADFVLGTNDAEVRAKIQELSEAAIG